MDLPPAVEPASAPPSPEVDLEAIGVELGEVDAALARLDEGTYGRCAACDTVIDEELLAARPTARTCSAHLFSA